MASYRKKDPRFTDVELLGDTTANGLNTFLDGSGCTVTTFFAPAPDTGFLEISDEGSSKVISSSFTSGSFLRMRTAPGESVFLTFSPIALADDPNYEEL